MRAKYFCLLAWTLLTIASTGEAQTPPVLHAFGDSITVGGKASDFATKSYIALTASAQNWPLFNLAHSGDMAADAAVAIYGETVHAGGVYSLQIGVNDEWINGPDASKRTLFAAAHLAETAWLSIPASQKMTAHHAAIAYSGSWSDSALYPGVGMQSSQPGSHAVFSVLGSTVLLGISFSDVKSGCQLGLSIDGSTFGTWNPPRGIAVGSYNGTAFAPFLIRASGLSPGVHLVDLSVIACNSPNSYAFFDWAAGAGTGSGIRGASVYVVNVPRKSQAFYGRYPGGSDANVRDYNTAIATNIATLEQDGLPVHMVDAFTYLNTTTDLDVDGIHPNDSGHAHLSQAFVNAIAASNPTPGIPASGPLVANSAVTLGALESAQFTASNAGIDGESYSWTISRAIGSISPFGRYTGPAVIPDLAPGIEVIATSKSNPARTGSGVVFLKRGLITGPVTPASGSGSSVLFQFDGTNGQPIKTLNTASILISGNGVTAAGMCFVKYDATSGKFFLGADAPPGPAYPANSNFWSGSATPGSTAAISNSQCTLVAANSFAVADSTGTLLHLGFAIRFNPFWTGGKTVYLSADDTLGHDTGWNKFGSWGINPAVLSAGPLTPSVGNDTSAEFHFDISNGESAATLNTASILISNNGVTAFGTCFVKYDVTSRNFFLAADDPSGAAYPSNPVFWAGSAAPASSGPISNSQCTLVPAASSAVVDSTGTVLHLGISLQFNQSWTADRIVYISADDSLNHDTGWKQAGTWNSAPLP